MRCFWVHVATENNSAPLFWTETSQQNIRLFLSLSSCDCLATLCHLIFSTLSLVLLPPSLLAATISQKIVTCFSRLVVPFLSPLSPSDTSPPPSLSLASRSHLTISPSHHLPLSLPLPRPQIGSSIPPGTDTVSCHPVKALIYCTSQIGDF